MSHEGHAPKDKNNCLSRISPQREECDMCVSLVEMNFRKEKEKKKERKHPEYWKNNWLAPSLLMLVVFTFTLDLPQM